jgi:hypothetical protein
MGAVQCPSCYKLAGLDEPEIENSSISIDGATVSVEVSIVRNAACCGGEIKRADLYEDFEIDHECEKVASGEEEADFAYDEPDFEPYITGGGRYAKSFVGASTSLTATCQVCEEQIEVPLDLNIAAGDMDV